MRLTTKITIVLALLTLGVWVVTFGVSVNNSASFYPEGTAEHDKLLLRFDVKTKPKWFGIPFFFTYYYNTPPYDLEIIASSDDLDLKSIYIQQVDLKYDDSNHYATTASDIAEPFIPVMISVRTSDARTAEVSFIDKPSTRAVISLPKLITRSRSMTLKITCHVFFQDNTSRKLLIVKELPVRKQKQILSYKAAMSL